MTDGMHRLDGIFRYSFWFLFFGVYLFLALSLLSFDYASSASAQEAQVEGDTGASLAAPPVNAVSSSEPEPREDFLSWGQVTRTVLSLLMVSALAVLALRFLGPRLLPQRRGAEGTSFQILDRMALNSENELLVVKRHDQEFLIALGSQGSRLLAISDATISSPLLKAHPDSLAEEEGKPLLHEVRSMARGVSRGRKT